MVSTSTAASHQEPRGNSLAAIEAVSMLAQYVSRSDLFNAAAAQFPHRSWSNLTSAGTRFRLIMTYSTSYHYAEGWSAQGDNVWWDRLVRIALEDSWVSSGCCMF